MASSDDLSVVNELERIYDEEYRPLSQIVYKLLPRNDGESASDYTFRLATVSHVSANEDLEKAVRALYTPAKKFIRLFIDAFNKRLCPSYFNRSGFARAQNIFVMLFPHDTLHWSFVQTSSRECPMTWKDLVTRCAKDTVFWELLDVVLYPAAAIDIEPFDSRTMELILQGVDAAEIILAKK